MTHSLIWSKEKAILERTEKRQRGQIVIFSRDGNAISMKNNSKDLPLDVLPIAGVPLNKPVARYRPFVMNEPKEIEQAIEDHKSGKMGEINF